MAIINETFDATINAGAHGNYNIVTSDTFNGTLGAADGEDGINLQGLVPGTTYTVSVTVDDLAGFSGLTLINHADFHSVTFHVTDGVPHVGVSEFVNGWTRPFVETSGITVDTNTNTLSFDFTPAAGFTSFAFQVMNGGASESYSITFAETDPYGVTDENDVVTGLATADDVALLRGDDSMDAGDGDDVIAANNGDDTVNGDGGNDFINGGSGWDQLNGGAGFDTIIGGSGKDVITGGDDDDTLLGANGADNLTGDTGNDLLDGGKGHDVLDGGTGNDTLSGSFGNDTMTGGADADLFRVLPGGGADVITDFQTGIDTIDINKLGISSFADLAKTDTVDGVVIDFGVGNTLTLTGLTAADLTSTDFALAPDLMLATNGDDLMKGSDDANIMSGLDGDDTIKGKDGDDVLNGDDGRDYLDGDAGNDTLNGGGDNDKLIGDAGADELNGGQRNDRLYGGADNDTLNGGQGNDQLQGDAGDDILNGGQGKDKMTGGAGIDTFIFASKSGRDQITDFEDGIDVLDFSAVASVTDLSGLTIAQDGADVVITYDGNNSLTLDNMLVADIDASDFVF